MTLLIELISVFSGFAVVMAEAPDQTASQESPVVPRMSFNLTALVQIPEIDRFDTADWSQLCSHN